MRNRRSNRSLRVALGFPPGLAFMGRLQQGIFDWMHRHGKWTLTRFPELAEPSLQWLQGWPGEGAFVFVNTSQDRRIASRLRIPVISLSSTLPDPGVPSVTVDHYAAGQTAARHLLERRFHHLAFYGTADPHYSRQRWLGFRDEARKHGASCLSLRVAVPAGSRIRWTNDADRLRRWLRRLPKPAGIFASTDSRAAMILEACAELALRVPRDAAVLGMDNDPIVCGLCQPPLSSVSRNDWEVGYAAAGLLDQLMRGQEKPRGHRLVAPDGIVQRQSTATFAVKDPLVADALEDIEKRLSKPFNVAEIADRSGLSRRQFESRFRDALGHPPYGFVNTLRTENAKRMLETPERNLTEIAAACGFSSLQHFRNVFVRETGLSPAAYRLRHEKRPARRVRAG